MKALPRFHSILQKVVAAQNGEIFDITNDTLQAAFSNGPDAIKAAMLAQVDLLAADWDVPFRPRLALVTGTAHRQEESFYGPTLHHAARFLSVAHPGQILLCQITAHLVREYLPDYVSLLDLGEHRLSDLSSAERLYQLNGPGLPADFPPLKTLNNQLTNLPCQPNVLIGRQAELNTLTDKLRKGDVHLITLTGMGGAGKTRLALQVAAETLGIFPDGVFFVPLDQLIDPSLVASSIASTLSMDLSVNQTAEETLKAYLHSRHILLVLDNFEHLLSAATLVSMLLASCPNLYILATSREALHLRGETEFPVSPLSVPSSAYVQPLEQLTQFASVTLFIQRAQAVRPSFSIDDNSAQAIAEICTYLDGLPLAIELAAARIRMFTPQELLARLEAEPSLQLLSAGPRDLPTRHQSMNKAFEWSYHLLSSAEQALFRHLGVFSGGFTLQAVEAVCFAQDEPVDDVLNLLSSLVDKYLVRRNDDFEEESRFSLLFILRQFALELLQQSGELQDYQAAHCAYFALFAEKIEPKLNSNDQIYWIANLEREHDNLRAALQWSISCRKTDLALRLSSSLVLFWTHRNHLREGRRWLEKTLSLTSTQKAPTDVHIKALRGVAWVERILGDQSAARFYYEQNLELSRKLEDPQEIAMAMGNLGYQIANQGDYTKGSRLLEEGITLLREIGDQIGLAHALNKLAVHAMYQRDFAYAKLLLEECLAIYRSLNNLEGIALTKGSLGSLEFYQGNYDQAMQLLDESYERHKGLGQEYYRIEGLSWLALVHMHKGNLLTARQLYEEVIRGLNEIGAQTLLIDTLEGLAGIASKRGGMHRAAKLFGVAESLRETLVYPVSPADRPILEGLIDETRSRMKKDEYTKAWSEGRKLGQEGMEKVIELALEPDYFPKQRLHGSSPTSLTARETEILRLLAQGLGDVQIAQELTISPRTVNAHITSIFSKLGVHSRSAATRYALDHNLT
jgi:predicted ATPase/DNA-binding CsgD family transcriptional regulator